MGKVTRDELAKISAKLALKANQTKKKQAKKEQVTIGDSRKVALGPHNTYVKSGKVVSADELESPMSDIQKAKQARKDLEESNNQKAKELMEEARLKNEATTPEKTLEGMLDEYAMKKKKKKYEEDDMESAY